MSLKKQILDELKEHPESTPHDMSNRIGVPVVQIYKCVHRIRSIDHVPIQMIDGKYVLPENVNIEAIQFRPSSSRAPSGTTKRDIILKNLIDAGDKGDSFSVFAEAADVTRGAFTAHVSCLRKRGHIIEVNNGNYTYKGKKDPVPAQPHSQNIEAERPKVALTDIFVVNTEKARQAVHLLPKKLRKDFQETVRKANLFNKLVVDLQEAYKTLGAD